MIVIEDEILFLNDWLSLSRGYKYSNVEFTEVQIHIFDDTIYIVSRNIHPSDANQYLMFITVSLEIIVKPNGYIAEYHRW